MPKLIEGTLAEGARIVDDLWIEADTRDAIDAAPRGRPVLVPLALWQQERASLIDSDTVVGVRLEPSDDPEALAIDLPRLTLVAIHFPKFTDGRGYSIARLLRERHGYRGTIRAVGDVLRDQLFYMLRCGFDAFALKHQDLVDDALTAYRDFSEGYQSSVERPVPLFKRRLIAAQAERA